MAQKNIQNFSPFYLNGNTIQPVVPTWDYDFGSGNITTTGIISGDGSGITNLPISIGDTITGATDQEVLFTNGTTLAQDSVFSYDDAINTLRVGGTLVGGITNANSVTTGIFQAVGVRSAAMLGSNTMQYRIGDQTAIIQAFKSNGPANTHPNFEIILTDATNSNDNVIFSATDLNEIVINETGADYNFRVETDTDPNFFFIDAGTNLLSIAGTVGVNAVIDDDTFATATATNLATAESIQAYVDAQVGGFNTLQGVYDGPTGTGSGRVINVANGATPVQIGALSAFNAMIIRDNGFAANSLIFNANGGIICQPTQNTIGFGYQGNHIDYAIDLNKTVAGINQKFIRARHGVDTVFDVNGYGATSITSVDTSNVVPLTVTQNDVTNNGNAFNLVNTGTGLDINATNWSMTQGGDLIARSGVFDTSVDTFASLELTPRAAAPTTGALPGQLVVAGDNLFVYDDIRTKWLNVAAGQFTFSSNGNIDNSYLRFGQMLSSTSGALMPVDSTIVAIGSDSAGGDAAKGFELQVNGVSQYTWNNVANQFTATNLDVNVNAGDRVTVFCVAAGGTVLDPAVNVWFKPRLD